MNLKLKDIIIVSLLGVIGFVISIVAGMAVGVFGIYGIFLNVSISSFLTAPIYFVMCHKIHKRGAIFIYYLLSGIIYAIVGFVPMIPVLIAAGLVGEIIIFKQENYTNNLQISISYVISQVVYALHGFFFIVFFGVSGIVETFPNLFTEEKATQIKNLFFNPMNMAIILGLEIIACILGVIFAKYINSKFFDKERQRGDVLS